MLDYQIGQMYYADLGKARGHEQQGDRPIVVICEDETYHALVTVCPMTRTLTESPTHVMAHADVPSCIQCEQVGPVDKRFINRKRYIGTLPPAKVDELVKAINYHLKFKKEVKATENKLEIFKNNKFGEIRSIDIEGKAYFVAVDITGSLGYKDSINAVKQHCKGVAKHHLPHPQSPEKFIEVNIIPIGDVCRLAASSELPGADEFESWIFDEVIPKVLETGSYSAVTKDSYTIEDPIERAKVWIKEQEEKNTLTARVIHDKPFVDFAQICAHTTGSMLVREVAKLASKDGITIGEKTLYSKLREWGMIMPHSTEPYQKAVKGGYLEIEKTPVVNSKCSFTAETTMVLPKGQIYIVAKLKKEVDMLPVRMV